MTGAGGGWGSIKVWREAAHMAASLTLLQITSVDLMHPQSKVLPLPLAPMGILARAIKLQNERSHGSTPSCSRCTQTSVARQVLRPAITPPSRPAIRRHRVQPWGSLVMYVAASRSVTSGFWPGTAIGSTNHLSQDTNCICP
jgi:hypothetical protein